MQRSIVLETVYPHPPERVWHALTNRHALATWLMDNNFEPCVGHQFQFWDRSLLELNIAIDCQVIALEAPKRLVYTWRHSWMKQHSLVTWTLEEIETGTRLQLYHSGLIADVDPSRSFISPFHFWKEQFKQQPSATLLQRNTNYSSVATLHSPSYQFLETTIVGFNAQKWCDKLERKLRQVLE